MSKNIYTSREFYGKGMALLKDQFPNIKIGLGPYPMKQETLINEASKCHGLISYLTDIIDKKLIDSCPNLKVISNYAVGFNNIDVAYATQKGIMVGNTPDVLTKATAELTMALMLNLTRNIHSSYQDIKNGNWSTWTPKGWLGSGLYKKKLGIFGMGRIGQEVARLAQTSFEMEILYSSNTEKELNIKAERLDFETLLSESDLLSVHSDLNPSTRNLFDQKTFSKMKTGSFFINTSRGEIHNQNDLINNLENSHLAGAALDVTNPEPINLDSPLLNMKNVIITPHIGSATFDAREQMGLLAANNIIMGLLNKPLPGFVNPEVFKI